MSIRAIFLDKDGTLIDDVPYNADPCRVSLCSGVGAALRLLSRLDYRLFVVSNQAGVAHGHFDEMALAGVQDRIDDLLFREQVTLAGYYFCPHHPKGHVAPYAVECLCRKPMPGMLIQAAREHDIDLHASWMMGDILHDVEAGNRAGCRTILIDSGNETEWRLGQHRMPTRVVADIYAAACIVARDAGARE
jgi:D-glycero-D-manno-heptose 1,7-bisphosphate phosphatase